MKIPTWLSLAQLSGYPVSQIGEWGKLLSRLHQNSLPLPELTIVPTQTLQAIAEANRLPDRLTTVVLKHRAQPETLKSEVLSLFKSLAIPREIARDLAQVHHTQINKHLARIDTSSALELGKGLSLDLIHGDANTIESLLELWAHSYLRTKQLTAAAFIIQPQTQPTYSGYILTKDIQGGSAKQMPVWVTKGASPASTKHHPYSRYLVDVRTWNVTFRQETTQEYQLIRTPDELKSSSVGKAQVTSLSDESLAKLAQIAHQIKLLYLPHSCITWELSSDHIIITGLTPLGEEKLPELNKVSTSVLLQGNTIQPGYVEGTAIVGVPGMLPTQLPAHSILVVPEVTVQLKPYLRHAVGLVSEKSLPLFAQQLLAQSLLPTIAPARDATKKLSPNQAITLDANKGVVLRSSPKPSSIRAGLSLTKTKVFISVANPAKTKTVNLSDVDGTYFSSDFTFYQQGVHPQHLVRSAQNQQFTQVLVDRIRLFKAKAQTPLLYQPLSLSSADLLQLQYAHGYDQAEANPYLGYRGSVRHLHSFDILNTELAALNQVQQLMGQNLGLVIPFTRTIGELRLMLNHVRSVFSPHLVPFELWWQVALPSNIWQISQFMSPQLTGVIISIPDLHALMHGIDPNNPDLLLKYPVDIPLMRTLIKQVFAACPNHKIILHLNEGYDDLVQLAVELGLAGVIVKPYHAERTKRIISEMETHVINHI